MNIRFALASNPKSHDHETARQEAAGRAAHDQAPNHSGSSVIQNLARWVKETVSGKPENSLRQALEEVLEEHESGSSLLSPEEKALFKNMLTFGDLTVHDIMVPRTDIEAVECRIELPQLQQYFLEIRHTRLPVYDDTLDNIIGFVHLKDLLPMFCGNTAIQMDQVVREILFVPPSMRIIDLLVKMRLSGCHMAIVVDEYGGTDGLVTMEDLFEEIVGEIQDEHDEDEAESLVVWVSDHVLEADARATVEEMETELQMDLNAEDADDCETLGGLISSFLGRVPAKGEIIHHSNGIKFEILEADPRRIRRVRVIKHGPDRPATRVSVT